MCVVIFSSLMCIIVLSFFFLIIRRPPRSTRLTHSFPTRRSSDLLLDHARCRLGCDRAQMLVQSHKVRRCLARPLDLHLTGEGSGLSVPRLSAHAWIA